MWYAYMHSGVRRNLSKGAYAEFVKFVKVCKLKTQLLKVVLVIVRKLFQTYIPNYSKPITLFRVRCRCMSIFLPYRKHKY